MPGLRRTHAPFAALPGCSAAITQVCRAVSAFPSTAFYGADGRLQGAYANERELAADVER